MVTVTKTRRRLQGTRCQTQEFIKALDNALRRSVRLGLPDKYFIIDVIVDPAQAANCVFPFKAQIRNTVKCGIPCNQAQVTKVVADDSKCFWLLLLPHLLLVSTPLRTPYFPPCQLPTKSEKQLLNLRLTLLPLVF